MIESLRELAKAHFGIVLSDDAVNAFAIYTEELIAWNMRFNLTALTEPADILIKHFLDSLSLLTLASLPDSARLIDVGTGAGFPGLALKIAQPHWDVTLLEATGKKVQFLDHVITTLAMKGAQAVHMRAEDAGQSRLYRGQYDLVVARAVARLPVLLEYLLPLSCKGGLCVAMKGETVQVEMDDTFHALEILGGQIETTQQIALPLVEQKHYLVVIRKIKETPSKYPRRVGLPSKN